MFFLSLVAAMYVGGIISTIGFVLAGMTQQNNLRGATLFTYLYAFTCCVAWPVTIYEQIVYKDE